MTASAIIQTVSTAKPDDSTKFDSPNQILNETCAENKFFPNKSAKEGVDDREYLGRNYCFLKMWSSREPKREEKIKMRIKNGNQVK